MYVIPAGDKAELVAEYMTEKTGAVFQPGLYQALAILSDAGDFVGGVIVSNFRGTDCEISCAAETPAAWRPTVMCGVFTYIFMQLGCVRCTSITTKRNRKARNFLLDLGFQLEGNIRLGYDGTKDALIYGLLASECRWIKAGDANLDGQEVNT